MACAVWASLHSLSYLLWAGGMLLHGRAVGPVVVTQGDRCLAALMMVSRKWEDYQKVMHRLIDLLEVKLARPVVEAGDGDGFCNARTLAHLGHLILPAENPAGSLSIVPHPGHVTWNAFMQISPSIV